MKPTKLVVPLAALALVMAVFMFPQSALGQVETIDATARGTSTQMGKTTSVKVIISQFSTAEDRETLKNAFVKGGHEGLMKALSKMKSCGRIQIPGTLGFSLAYARTVPTATGHKIRFVTDRKIAFGESASNTRSKGYDMTAGEIEINDQDPSKSTGVLYPAVKVTMNKNGEPQFDLFQNPWQLVNITDWKPKEKQ